MDKKDTTFILTFLLFLTLGGMHIINFYYSNLMFILICSFYILVRHVTRKDVRAPYGFKEYLLCIILFLITLLWSVNKSVSLYFLSLFITGGLLWIIFYNYQRDFREWVKKLVLILGLTFLGLYFFNLIKGEIVFDSLTLYLPVNLSLNHVHLGDLWSLVIIICLEKILKNRRGRNWWFLLLGVGVYVQIISLSRSAVVALVAGGVYLSKRYKKTILNFKTIFILVVTILIIFLYAGSNKSVFSSRPYFIQAISSVPKNLFGVGYGNFGIVSLGGGNGTGSYSAYTHNIILEIFVGFGIWGFIFLYWIYKVFKNVFFEAKNGNYLFKALLLTLSINFLFDFTYVIPTMLWMWFIFLGLSQKSLGIKSAKITSGG